MNDDPVVREMQNETESYKTKIEQIGITIQKFLLVMKKLQWSIHNKDPSSSQIKLEFEAKKKELEAISKDIKDEYNKDPWSWSGSWNWDQFNFKSPAAYRSKDLKSPVSSSSIPTKEQKTPEK